MPPLNKLSPQKRSVAVVFQAFVNYPNWSVQQNIASPMVAAGKDKAYIQSRVAELAAKLGLGELLQRMPNELSGGQQQRLAIARALAKEAQVLLLDEPLVNLDINCVKRWPWSCAVFWMTAIPRLSIPPQTPRMPSRWEMICCC